jgi:hypothetical protein
MNYGADAVKCLTVSVATLLAPSCNALHSSVARLELAKILGRRRVVVVQLVQLHIVRSLFCGLLLQ